MQKRTYNQDTPTITKEFFDVLEKRFSYRTPSPGMTMDEIMYEAGRDSVVQWCRDHIRNSVQDNKVNRTID